MCCRVCIDPEDAPQIVRDGLETLRRKGIEPVTGDVCPGDRAMVFANNKKLDAAPFSMCWGYRVDEKRLVFNARSETAEEKRLFAEGMTMHRCVLPVSWYYEWRKTEQGKQKYLIRPVNGEGFYLAGIYRMENDVPAFTVLTKAPDESVAFIHDRMPVLLSEKLIPVWLNLRFRAGDVLKMAGLEVRGEAV